MIRKMPESNHVAQLGLEKVTTQADTLPICWISD